MRWRLTCALGVCVLLPLSAARNDAAPPVALTSTLPSARASRAAVAAPLAPTATATWAVLPGPMAPVADAADAVTVEVVGLESGVLNSITPTIRVRASRGLDDPPPIALGVRISLSPSPEVSPIVDTLVAGSDSVAIALTTPLPSGATVYIIGFARSPLGGEARSQAVVRMIPQWLTLVSPNAPGGAILDDVTPMFVWSAAPVSAAAGPWSFDFTILPTAGGPAPYSVTTTDTSVAVPFPLELNTSYRWSITASLADQSNVTVLSRSSFVIVDQTVPRASLLYQTFPNPFPSAVIDFACIWFDLARQSTVTLDVLDIRTNVVRRIYPPYGVRSLDFPAGRYGRAVSSESGCTREFSWDGTDDRGSSVIAGVYLLRLRADGRDQIRSMIFRGK